MTAVDRSVCASLAGTAMVDRQRTIGCDVEGLSDQSQVPLGGPGGCRQQSDHRRADDADNRQQS